MRSTKVITITMPPEMAEQAAKLAKQENRTTSELFREAFRRYQQQGSQQVAAQEALAEMRAAVADLRTSARKSGVNKLSNVDIDREIAAVRKRKQRKPLTRTSGK
jgi:predicted DNA-binding protein